jgi:hypothetical protein
MGLPGEPRNCPYARITPFAVSAFVKSFFIAKTSCTYTMNYLQQEKGLRDHEVSPDPDSPNCRFYANCSRLIAWEVAWEGGRGQLG